MKLALPKHLLISLFSLTLIFNVFSQDVKGTEFWFTYPEVVPTAGGNSIFIASDFCIDSLAYIEIPGLGWKVDFTVERGNYTEIVLPSTFGGQNTYADVAQRIQNKGIHIVTPKPVTAYFSSNDAASSDGETILPINYLGTKYVTSIRSAIAIGGIEQRVVATENNTNITYKTWNNAGSPVTYNIKLNKGDVYYWHTTRRNCNGDFPRGMAYDVCSTFDGAVLTSDKPIASVTTAECSGGWDCGACEVFVNMNLPEALWGKEYVTVQAMERTSPNVAASCGRAADVSGDYISIMGAVGTKVTVNGKGTNNQVYVIPPLTYDNGAGYGYGYLFIELPGDGSLAGGDYGFANSHITADNPVQVTQYPKGWQTDNSESADPEAFKVFPVSAWSDSYLFAILFKGSTIANTVAIITEDPAPAIRLNGNPIAGWTTIPNTNYRYHLEPTLLSTQTNRIFNDNNIPFGITMVSAGQANSYLISGGSGDILEVSQCPDCPLSEFDTDKDFYCLGETTFVTDKSKDDDPSGATKIVKWEWDFGDGTTQTFTTSQNPTHKYSSPGNYTITLTVTNDADPVCPQTYIKNVRVGPGIQVDAGPDITGCEDDKVTLGGSPTALGGVNPKTYRWNNPGDLNNASNANPVVTIQPGTTVYSVTVTDSINCSVTDEVTITGIQKDSIYLVPVGSGIYCEGDMAKFKVIAKNGVGSPYDIDVNNSNENYTYTNVNENDEIEIPIFNDNPQVSIIGVSGQVSCVKFSNAPVQVTTKPYPNAKILEADTLICLGDQASIKLNLTGDLPWSIDYTFNGAPETVNNINSAIAYAVLNPTESGTFSLNKVYYSNDPECPIDLNESRDITVQETKNAGTAFDTSLCASVGDFDLKNYIGQNVDHGEWIDPFGSGALSSDGIFSTSDAPQGAYLLTHRTTENGPCPADEIEIELEVVGFPQAVEIIEECSNDLKTFKVKMKVSGGDPNTYFSAEGTFNGGGFVKNFTSQVYQSKSTYDINIVDENNCGVLNVSNYVNCGCKTKAGSMSQAAIDICYDTEAECENTGEVTLLPGDTLLYVLHEGSGLQIVNPIKEQGSPIFTFKEDSLNAGMQYFVSAVAGPKLGNSVDYSSDCINITQGQPVKWNPLVATSFAVNSYNLCLNQDSVEIDLNFNGAAPFATEIASINHGNESFENLPATTSLKFEILGNDSLSLPFVSDKYCTDTTDKNIGNFFIHDAPALNGTPSVVCNDIQTKYQLSIAIHPGADLTSMNVVELIGSGNFNASKDTFITDFINSGDSYHFQFNDKYNCGILEVQGAEVCNCVTISKQISATENYAHCMDSIVTISSNGGQFDGNDVQNFALHPNPNYNASEVIAFFPDENISFQPGMLAEQTYYVTAVAGSDVNGDNLVDLNDLCLDTGNTVQVYFYELPDAEFNNTTVELCEGAPVNFNISAKGAAPFNIWIAQEYYNRTPIEIDTVTRTLNSSPGTITINPEDTSYIDIIRVIDANNCVSKLKNRANAFTLSSPSLNLSTEDSVICLGESIEIEVNVENGEGPFDYQIRDLDGNTIHSGNFNGARDFVNYTPTDSVEIFITNLADATCTGADSPILPIDVNPIPSVDINAKDNISEICNGDILEIEINVSGIDAHNFDVNVNCNTKADSLINLNTGSTSKTFNYEEGNNTYISSITNTTTGCASDGNTINVARIELPELDLDGSYDVCQGNSIDINYSATGTAPFTFEITDDLGNTYESPYTVSSNNGSINLKFDSAGTRTISVTNIFDNKCINNTPDQSNSATVEVISLDEILFTADTFSGCEPMNFTISNLTNQNQIVSCNWYLNDELISTDKNGFFTTLIRGNYDLKLGTTYNSGCYSEYEAEDYLRVFPKPVAEFSYSPNNPTIINPIVNFNNLSTDSETAIWRIDTLANATGDFPTFTFPYDNEGNYTVYLTAISDSGCVDSTSENVFIKGELIYYIPTAFSPNNDGVNDCFKPELNGTEEFLLSYEFSIYNRWGEQVYTSKTINGCWDGTYNMKNALPGIYTYKIIMRSQFSAEKIMKHGRFTLIR